MITDGKKLHYLVIKNLFALSREITIKHNDEYTCINCDNSFDEKIRGEEILSNGPNQIIEQSKFTYSSLGKSIWKTNENN